MLVLDLSAGFERHACLGVHSTHGLCTTMSHSGCMCSVSLYCPCSWASRFPFLLVFCLAPSRALVFYCLTTLSHHFLPARERAHQPLPDIITLLNQSNGCRLVNLHLYVADNHRFPSLPPRPLSTPAAAPAGANAPAAAASGAAAAGANPWAALRPGGGGMPGQMDPAMMQQMMSNPMVQQVRTCRGGGGRWCSSAGRATGVVVFLWM